MKLMSMGMLMVLALAGCGGGGGGTASTGVSTGGTTGATSAAQLAQICSANNPFRADALEPTRAGSLADERNWIRAYFDERYLWYRDVPAVSANADKYNVTTYFNPYSNFVESINNYFQDLRNPAFTVTGTKVDKFSFLTSTSYWNDYSQGEALGYGWQLSDQGTLATRRVRVSHVFQSTQTGFAALASVQRGDEILSVNGNPVNSTSTSIQNVVNQALSPSAAVNTTFVIRPVGSVSTRTVTLTAANVVLPQAEHKVVIDQGVKWGYLLFNAHIDSAEAPLLAAMTDFQAQGIDQLVLDLRYNGGGYLAMASAVSYAIAGVARTQNKTFETLRYNDKRSGGNQSVPFYSTGRNSVAPFATLNLSKVYVLTTADTCSASESIINGLRGIDVEVVQIGSTTCGKPYGFVPQDNCGITYAAMEFEGVNDKGLGGFSDGFVPQCAVSDDLSFQLGVTTEPMFATAIARHRGLPCTSPSASSALSSANLRGMGASTQRVIRPHWQEAKILKPSATAP